MLTSPALDGSCACCACLSALFFPADHCMFLRHQNSCVVFMSHVTMSCDVLYVCMYTYLFAVMHVCVLVTPLYLCMYVCMYHHPSVCMNIFVCVHTCSLCISLYISVYLCICAHLRMYVHICMWTCCAVEYQYCFSIQHNCMYQWWIQVSLAWSELL